MDSDTKAVIQTKVDRIPSFWNSKTHQFPDVPKTYLPWTSNLSPSALYNCSLPCRKKMGIKTFESKWMSIKRWVQVTPYGITLPQGVYLSIKRAEKYVSDPEPKFIKTEYNLVMFPFGNVWSQKAPGVPIDEDWLWSESNGMLILEALMRKDAAHPVIGYFKSTYDYMTKFPDQIGIHLKRKSMKT